MIFVEIYLLAQAGIGLIGLLRARALYRVLRKLREDFDNAGRHHVMTDEVIEDAEETDVARLAQLKADTAIPETRYAYARRSGREMCLWSDCTDDADGFYCDGHRPYMTAGVAR